MIRQQRQWGHELCATAQWSWSEREQGFTTHFYKQTQDKAYGAKYRFVFNCIGLVVF